MPNPRSRLLTTLPQGAEIPLLVHGQGTFLFECKTNDINSCIFYIFNKERTKGLSVEFAVGYIHVCIVSVDEPKPLIDEYNTMGLLNKSGASYWFSVDTHNKILCGGIGEPRLETVMYEYKFIEDVTEFLESLTFIKIDDSNIKPLKLLRDPIISNVSLLVKNTDDLTMMDIATGKFLPKANLSPIAQQLYDCISGKKFVLDDDDFPEFSQAIERSIHNPNGWCYKRLKEKETEFNKKPDPLETYLRITLGQNSGESPGVPYVMEIWPVGHYSPVHNHSKANAMIRVLHGKIQVELYPFLCDDIEGVKPFNTATFVKDDITWMSSTHNQVHKLTNVDTNIKTCITIQCYMYNEDDDSHYDYFDYIGDKGKKQQYTPDSDMDFVAFRQLMYEEWLSV